MGYVVVSLLIAGVFGGDQGKEKVVKVKNTYPATHNILGNLYNTKHGHAIHEYYGHGSDHGYDHRCPPPPLRLWPEFQQRSSDGLQPWRPDLPQQAGWLHCSGDRDRYYRYPWQRDVDYHYARGLGYTK